MKVKAAWLVIPIVFTVLLIGVAVYMINYFQIEKSDTGYTYKQELFNEDELGTIEITVSEKNWQTILDDPMAEVYVEASVKINDVAVDNVGIRAKGNSSLMSVASSDSERYSLKIDFAQYNNTQTYYGLETLNLNNNFSDSTQMKEFVSYELMEQLGIATPAHSYVKVLVNGEYYGLMLAVEEVGEAFAKTNYGNMDGFIFKPEGNGSDLKYVSDDTTDYVGIFDEVKMNKQTAENNSNVVEMMKEISLGDTYSLDVDQLARYFALNTALVNMDSYQGSFKHNYYLREDKNGVFSIIPWDYNMSFGGFTGMGDGPGGRNGNEQQGEVAAQEVNTQQGPPDNDTQREMQAPPNFPSNGEQGEMQALPNFPTQGNEQNVPERNVGDTQNNRGNQRGGGMMTGQEMLTENNIDFSITEPVSGTTIDERPLLKIILEDEEARSLYDSYLEKIATELLTEENILAITEPLEALLLDAVEEDPSKFTTTEQFLTGVRGEKSIAQFAKQRSESILKQLAGEIEGISGAGSGFGGGGMPGMNGGEMPNFENMPSFEGMPDFENMPNFEGGPPNFGGGQGPPNMQGMPGQQGEVTSPVKSVMTVVASLVICVVAILFILLVSKRKYKRK